MTLLTRLLPSRWRRAQPPAQAEAAPLHLWRADLPGVRYVSENTLAVLSGETVPALHRLELFDADGRRVQVVEQRSRRQYVVLAPEVDAAAAPALGTVRLSLVPESERLTEALAELLRELGAAGRGCCQVRRLADGPWLAVQPDGEAALQPGGGAELALGSAPPPRLHALNPSAASVTLQVVAAGAAGHLGAVALPLPALGVRPVAVPAGASRLRVEAPRARVAPLLLLEPADPALPWRMLRL